MKRVQNCAPQTQEEAIQVMESLDKQLSGWERKLDWAVLFMIAGSIALLTAITGGFIALVMWINS